MDVFTWEVYTSHLPELHSREALPLLVKDRWAGQGSQEAGSKRDLQGLHSSDKPCCHLWPDSQPAQALNINRGTKDSLQDATLGEKATWGSFSSAPSRHLLGSAHPNGASLRAGPGKLMPLSHHCCKNPPGPTEWSQAPLAYPAWPQPHECSFLPLKHSSLKQFGSTSHTHPSLRLVLPLSRLYLCLPRRGQCPLPTPTPPHIHPCRTALKPVALSQCL